MTFKNSKLNTTDDRTWTFNIDEIDAFRLDAPAKAKKAVAESVDDTDYRSLRAKLVNSGQFGDTYVTVVEVL
jgi:hypothetical protein